MKKRKANDDFMQIRRTDLYSGRQDRNEDYQENMERKQRKAGIVMIQDLAYQNMMKMENLKDIIYILQKCL